MSTGRAAEAELDALLAKEAPGADEVEAALTHGHAAALELEANRLRLHRKLERASSINDPGRNGVIVQLREEIAAVTARMRSLQERLSEAGSRFGPRPRFMDRAG